MLYSHTADRLYSAGTDGMRTFLEPCSNLARGLTAACCGMFTGTICAYDVLHSYQPSRAYAASPGGTPSPCLAITRDDALLVAGSLDSKQCATRRPTDPLASCWLGRGMCSRLTLLPA